MAHQQWMQRYVDRVTSELESEGFYAIDTLLPDGVTPLQVVQQTADDLAAVGVVVIDLQDEEVLGAIAGLIWPDAYTFTNHKQMLRDAIRVMLRKVTTS